MNIFMIQSVSPETIRHPQKCMQNHLNASRGWGRGWFVADGGGLCKGRPTHILPCWGRGGPTSSLSPMRAPPQA